jgi:hypothetical protein
LSIVSKFLQETMGKFSQGEPWVRSSAPLYDVFEPTFVQCALEREDNLGHLVFGTETWKSMGGHVSNGQDPLTSHFRKRGT